METKIFTSEEIRDLKIDAIARKYKVSNTYIRSVLKGGRNRNTDVAQKMLKDVMDMFEILERETLIEA